MCGFFFVLFCFVVVVVFGGGDISDSIDYHDIAKLKTEHIGYPYMATTPVFSDSVHISCRSSLATRKPDSN